MTVHTIFRAPVALVGALALCFVVLAVQAAQAGRTIWVDATSLDTALSDAQAGDLLVLAPGDYDTLNIEKSGAPLQPVVLRAADIENRPVFPGLRLTGADHVTLDGLIFRMQPRSDTVKRNVHIRDAEDITLSRNLFEGARRPDTDGFAHPWGFGLTIDDSTDVALFDNELRGFARGLVVRGVDRLTVARNEIHSMRTDGMIFAQVADVLIEDNVIRDFDRAPGRGDHPDMIQFWTRDTERPSRQITIRRNILNSGEGYFTQSIFMRNEMVDTNQAGEDMFYRDVVIEENVIINAHLHGITVGATVGLMIRRNTVVRNAASQGDDGNIGLWTPQITVDAIARDVLILNNVAHALPEPGWQPGWVIAGNQIVQDLIPGQADHYDQVFFGVSPATPARVTDFAARPGGLLDGRDVGASRLVAISVEVAKTAPDDVTDPGMSDLRGIIRLEPDRLALLADGGAGSPPLVHELGGSEILLGDTLAPTVLTRQMTGALFDAARFVIDMRLRPTGDYRTAGEVLRLHESLKVGVTGRGVFEVEVFSDLGGVARLKTRATSLYRDAGPLDLTIAYDGPVGALTVIANGEIIGQAPFSGQLRPVASWGLSFGNPFGTHLSFDGAIETFEVRTDPADMTDVFDIINASVRQ
ncbi:Right handed beta helix region [Jannaschia faecimaris]|uniref:Right handed beta helix region n=2 Tax=Jannaschia faecimaris TaxID=1244108 RepID=A0A1H3J1C3_9RHOB|nr:Right handed beta helix region [Jannaschia faecimaris]